MTSYVFISYAREDAPVVAKITDLLSTLGIEYFQDAKDIPWGAPFKNKIQNALQKATEVLVVLSPNSAESQWVPFELGQAAALNKKIVPYVTHPEHDFSPYLSELQHVSTIAQIRDYFSTKADRETDPTAPNGPLFRSLRTISSTRLSSSLSTLITGNWIGEGHQVKGPDGGPVDFPLKLTLAVQENELHGRLSLTFKMRGEDIAVTMGVTGSVVDDRFIWINYTAIDTPGIHFGTVIGDLNEDELTMTCHYAGYGAYSNSPVSGYGLLKKAI